jgi:hypothetical protein
VFKQPEEEMPALDEPVMAETEPGAEEEEFTGEPREEEAAPAEAS